MPSEDMADRARAREARARELLTQFEDKQREAEEQFVSGFTSMQRRVADNARNHGFWEAMPPHLTTSALARLMLVTTELAEAAEAVRASIPQRSDHLDNYSLEEEEIADAVIRLMDYAESRHIDLANALVAKVKYNTGRSHLHGKRA